MNPVAGRPTSSRPAESARITWDPPSPSPSPNRIHPVDPYACGQDGYPKGLSSDDPNTADTTVLGSPVGEKVNALVWYDRSCGPEVGGKGLVSGAWDSSRSVTVASYSTFDSPASVWPNDSTKGATAAPPTSAGST